MVKLRENGSSKPFRLCRVAAQKARLITNYLILLIKICNSRIFAAGLARYSSDTLPIERCTPAYHGRSAGGHRLARERFFQGLLAQPALKDNVL
jgi:hypothetical protein